MSVGTVPVTLIATAERLRALSETKRWEDFSPTGYELNWAALSNAALEEIGEGQSRIPTTAGAILREVMPHRFGPVQTGEDLRAADGSIGAATRPVCQVKTFGGGFTIETPQRTIRLNTLQENMRFPAQVIEALLEIDRAVAEGEALHPVFFYYDKDHVTDDVHDSFSFFVVNGSHIVVDRVSVSRHRTSGFDPAFFKPAYESCGVWASDEFVGDAKVRWWYRKFYQDTDAGQLTALREDAPIYHFVPEWKQQAVISERIRQIAEGTAAIRRLLIFVVLALALITYLLWK